MIGIAGPVIVLILAVISSGYYAHGNSSYKVGKQPQIEGTRSFRLVYRYIQITTVVAAIGSYVSGSPIFARIHQSPALASLGLVIACLVMLGFIWTKSNLGPNYSPCFDPYVPNQFVAVGPYRYIRHPLYSLNISLLLGLFTSTGSLWIAINTIILAAYYGVSAKLEEKALCNSFPEYGGYQLRTKRFIPLIF